MEFVRNGKIYDTETATAVFSEYGTEDIGKTIYITKNKNWFTVERHDADDYGNIAVLSEDEAFTFLEESDCVGVIKKYFPDRIEEA